MPRIGLITTGNGPRDEYCDYHRGLLSTLGYPVEILDEHILDGLTWSEVEPHIGTPEEHVLGSYVKMPDALGPRMPNGGVHAYFKRDWAAQRIQQALERLSENGADLAIFCAAAPFPADAFSSTIPVLKPADIVTNTVQELTRHAGRTLDLGLITTAGHGSKDLEFWQSQPFADKLNIRNAVFEKDPIAAAEALGAHHNDVVVIWSYGWGLLSKEEQSLSEKLEDMLGCTVLMPHRITALTAASLIRCGFDDRKFAA